MVVFIGQKYDPEVRRLVGFYAVKVLDYELPDWYHQLLRWERGADPHDHWWQVWDFGISGERISSCRNLV